MKSKLRFLPLALLIAFVGFVAWRLANPADSTVRSRLAGKPVPAFALPPALPGRAGLSSADLATGQPRLVIDGIAIRDRPEDVADFLRRHGDPYGRIGADMDSAVQLALGSSGVPESFVVDGRGIIRHQHVGAIAAKDIPAILAELEKAR